MKKISILIPFFILYSIFSFSQSITNRSSSVVTVQDSRLMAQYNLFFPRYTDTTAANIQKGIDSCGATIYTYSTNSLWYRQCNPKKWVQIVATGNVGDTVYWKLGGNNLLSGGIDALGSIDYSDMSFITNNNKRLILLKDGISNNNNNTVKLLGVDTNTAEIVYKTIHDTSYYNSNIGTGYRLAIPYTNNIKTLNAGYGILNDSTSNLNGITQKVDTTLLLTLFKYNNDTLTLYRGDGRLISNRLVHGNEKNLYFDSINKYRLEALSSILIGADGNLTLSTGASGFINGNWRVGTGSTFLFSDSLNYMSRLGRSSDVSDSILVVDYSDNGRIKTRAQSSIIGVTPTLQQVTTAGNTTTTGVNFMLGPLFTPSAGTILGNNTGDGFLSVKGADGSDATLDFTFVSNKTLSYPNQSGFLALRAADSTSFANNMIYQGVDGYFHKAAVPTGTVTSVSGTTNRITSTGGATPVIDISSSYVGQSSITTLGTIGTGTWQGTAVGAGFGGTGQSTYAVGDLLYASASTTLSKLADVATGNALISGGVTTAPSWGKIGLTTHVSGILPVANGGSGTSTAFTLGSVIFAGASGVYSQDNTNLFWDNTNKRIGMGTTSPTGKIHTLESGISDGVTFRGENSTAAGSTKAFTLGQMGSSGYGITGWASAAVLEGAADGGLTFSSFGGDTRWQTGSSRLTRMTLSGANLGIGVTSPTALLHLAAGTATANTAPLKFTSGTLNTTAVAGQHEYNNSHYLTKNSALRYGVGGSLAQFTTDASNTGTSETDLHSYTTPASTFASDGDKIFFDFGGTMPDATATITIKVYFGGTQIYTSGAIALSGTGDYHINGFLVRVNSTTIRAVVSGVHRSGIPLTSSDYTEVTGLTLSNTNILKITGQAGGGTGGTGDIVDKLGQIRYEPVAAN